jgi:hypothetical protein
MVHIYIRKLCNNKVGIKKVPWYNIAHTIPNYLTQAMKNLNIECPPFETSLLGWWPIILSSICMHHTYKF